MVDRSQHFEKMQSMIAYITQTVSAPSFVMPFHEWDPFIKMAESLVVVSKQRRAVAKQLYDAGCRVVPSPSLPLASSASTSTPAPTYEPSKGHPRGWQAMAGAVGGCGLAPPTYPEDPSVASLENLLDDDLGALKSVGSMASTVPNKVPLNNASSRFSLTSAPPTQGGFCRGNSKPVKPPSKPVRLPNMSSSGNLGTIAIPPAATTTTTPSSGNPASMMPVRPTVTTTTSSSHSAAYASMTEGDGRRFGAGILHIPGDGRAHKAAAGLSFRLSNLAESVAGAAEAPSKPEMKFREVRRLPSENTSFPTPGDMELGPLHSDLSYNSIVPISAAAAPTTTSEGHAHVSPIPYLHRQNSSPIPGINGGSCGSLLKHLTSQSPSPILLQESLLDYGRGGANGAATSAVSAASAAADVPADQAIWEFDERKAAAFWELPRPNFEDQSFLEF